MVPGDLDRPAAVSPEPPRSSRRPLWARGLACVAILPLLGFIGGKSRTLWDEWRELRIEQGSERSSAVIGYLDISPNPSMADRPADWIHDEDSQTLLWAGYRNSRHQWFRAGRGEIEPAGLSLPIGRDTIRAVDRPIFERAGGARWGRILDEAPVVGMEGGDEPAVYPVLVLGKVVAVNDRSGDRPILVTYSPSENEASFYRTDREGRPLLMGLTGYFVGENPLLYDRGTESLWLERGEAMAAVAGPLKGAKLPRIARLAPVSWGDWRARHPGSRLLIGADRTKDGPPGPAPLAP